MLRNGASEEKVSENVHSGMVLQSDNDLFIRDTNDNLITIPTSAIKQALSRTRAAALAAADLGHLLRDLFQTQPHKVQFLLLQGNLLVGAVEEGKPLQCSNSKKNEIVFITPF